MPKFEGLPITIGGTEYIVPPLSFKQVKALQPEIEKLSKITAESATNSTEATEVMIKIIHSALQRNYPELTVEALEDMLDLGNVRTIIQAVMGISGFVSGGAVAGSVDADKGRRGCWPRSA